MMVHVLGMVQLLQILLRLLQMMALVPILTLSWDGSGNGSGTFIIMYILMMALFGIIM